MSKMLEATEIDYAYEHDLPVEYEKPDETKRRQKRNSSRKHRVVESARRAGVPLYDVPLDTDGVEFDLAAPMSKMLAMAEGGYEYKHDLPVEYETPEAARLRRNRNNHRKYLVRKSARRAGVPLYDMPLDTDGVEFDLAAPMGKMLSVANGDPGEGLAKVVLEGGDGETALAPPEDFWDRVADRVAGRLAASLFRQAPLS